MKSQALDLETKIQLNQLHRDSFFVKLQELIMRNRIMEVQETVHARKKAKEIVVFLSSGVKVVGWLKKYVDMTFWKIFTIYYDKIATYRDEILKSKQQEILGTLISKL
jgi:hypothetical protein